MRDMLARIDEGCGALIIGEDVLLTGGTAKLVDALARHPDWSLLPGILLARSTGCSRDLNALKARREFSVI